MDTNKMRDISREQFQKWHSTKHGWPTSNYEFYWNDNYYEDEDFQLAWDAWQASREAVVVELPPKISAHNTSESGWVRPEAEHYDEAIDDCREAIEFQGLKVTP